MTRPALRRAFCLASWLVFAPALGLAQDAPPTAHGYAGGDVAIEDILDALANAHPDNFRAIGTSSLTFQMQLTGAIDAAWRPETNAQRRGWLSELAAWRLADRLGMDSVPPAVVRLVERGQLRRRLDPELMGEADVILAGMVTTGASVRGTASYWIPNLARTSELDGAPGILRWSAWLAPGAEIPADRTALARDLSTMAVFDVLIANPDRASGANMRTVENRGVLRLAIRDHNLAFAARPADAQWGRMLTMLRRVRRFSHAFVERLEALDEAGVREAMADEVVGTLLDDDQIAAVMDRRETVLSWIGALVELHGEDAVLSLD